MSEQPIRTEAPRAARSAGLDLVRACAILMVLVSHCGDMFGAWLGVRVPYQVSLAGFFGVELFFVLSGFLIGRLLLRIIADRPTPRAWLVFMTRRWMRTLPLYFLWIAVLAVYWPPRFWEPDHGPLLWHVLPHFLTLTQNLAWPMSYEWFGVSWSLTVEEWFYLGFSALLLAAVALLGRRAGFWAAALVFLTVPPALRWQVPVQADFNEVLSKIAVLRLDAIAFGIVMAWLLPRAPVLSRHRWAAGAAGVLLIGGIWSGWLGDLLQLSPRVWRTFVFDMASLGFALCLPAAAGMASFPRAAGAVVHAVSRQSYAIYIIHLSILEFAGYYIVARHLPVAAAVVLSPVLIWGLSWVSWRWIEAPILACRPVQRATDSSRPAHLLPGTEPDTRIPAAHHFIANQASRHEDGATQSWTRPET
jgi:peptidoglycan/LPS O-acetylase OafA/YrhL